MHGMGRAALLAIKKKNPLLRILLFSHNSFTILALCSIGTVTNSRVPGGVGGGTGMKGQDRTWGIQAMANIS